MQSAVACDGWVCCDRLRVREYFERVDVDGSGSLDRGEIRTLCKDMLELDITEGQLDQGLAEMDQDGGGEVDVSTRATHRCL